MKRLIFTGIIVALALGLIFSGVPVAADDLGYSKIHIGFSVNPGHPGTLLEKGSRILHSADGTTKVYNKAGSLIMKTIDSESDMIVTQVGDKKANHIYFVPDNSTVVQNGNTDQVLDESNVLILTVINDNRSIVVPGLNPWIANTEYNFTFANSSSYYGSWSVPAPPINTNNRACCTKQKLKYISPLGYQFGYYNGMMTPLLGFEWL